jgi:hypothetical protein
MPKWLPDILARIRALAVARRVSLTLKAQVELVELRLQLEDVRVTLCFLTAEDFSERLSSKLTDEWMYVFKPQVGERVLYVKVVLREECVVVSFHQDEGEP